MSESTNLIPGLPAQIAIPIIVLTTAVSLGPKLIRLFSEFSGKSRGFKREKERLELLKLRYEVEAFKREKSLTDFIDTPPVPAGQPLARVSTRTEASPFLVRFSSGAVGAIVPTVLTVLIELLSTHSSPLYYFGWSYWATVLILACIGGALASVFPRRQADPFICFLIGLSFTLLLSLVGQRIQQTPPQVIPETSKVGVLGSIAPNQAMQRTADRPYV